MKHYELTYLVSTETSDIEMESLQNKIISFIQEKGGILNENVPFIKKRLAYPIKKKSEAFLGVLTFQLEPGDLEGIEKILKSEAVTLRHLMLIKKPTRIRPRRIGKFKIGPKEPQELLRPKKPQEKKVELKEIEKKIEEILKE